MSLYKWLIIFFYTWSIFAKLIDNVNYTSKGDIIMPKNYRVDLSDDTVVEIKKILEIGTKEGFDNEINVFKENGEFVITDQLLQYAKIKIDQPADIKDHIIYDPEQALSISDQTQSLQKVVWNTKTEDNTILDGYAWVNVHIPADKFIKDDNLSAQAKEAIRDANGNRESKDQVKVTATNNKENYQYDVFKDIPVCLWDDEAKVMPGAAKPIRFNITKEDCIKHYGIDEVSNYEHFYGTFTGVGPDAGEEPMFTISGNMFNEDRTLKYPLEGKITGHVHTTLADLNRMLADIGYEVVKKN